MATHYIAIYATKEQPWPPVIADDEGHTASTEQGDMDLTTDLQSGDVIIWEKSSWEGPDDNHPNAIVNIYDIEVSNLLVFSEAPEKQQDGSWKATVGEISNETDLKYTIYYDVRFIQDPKIRLRPSIGS